MSKQGTVKIDRSDLTDEQYITALERSNVVLSEEVYRLRQIIIEMASVLGKIK